MGAPDTLESFAPTIWKEKHRMMVIHLDLLAPYQGAIRGERPKGRSSGSGWREVTAGKTDPREDETKRSHRKKKRLYPSGLFGTKSLKEGGM
jgi:hypothetical protein